LREQRGWYIYDWANSAFASTVVTLFLGPYLTAVAKAAAHPDGFIYPFGIPVEPRSWWGYLVAFSVLLQVFFLPLVGTMADRSAAKKQLLAACAYVGAGATLAMFFIEGTAYLTGGVLFVIANVAFGASIVVYNAFLPEIATPEERDSVSSKGWGIGYLGGGIVLGLNLLLFSRAETLGITEALAVRISLASAGAWWAVFTLVALVRFAESAPGTAARESICLPPVRLYNFRYAEVPADIDLPHRVFAVQRCCPSGDCTVGTVRQRRTENPYVSPHAGDSDGAVCRLRGSTRVQRSG
jgi:MFS-type transporter involved in bile tolerance (Atg22 family)